MRQAARSGKQNIAEGSAAGTTSKETEIKLTNVAKASLQELLIDYEDYLRVREKEVWPKDGDKAMRTREFCRRHEDAAIFRAKVRERSDEIVANNIFGGSPNRTKYASPPCNHSRQQRKSDNVKPGRQGTEKEIAPVRRRCNKW